MGVQVHDLGQGLLLPTTQGMVYCGGAVVVGPPQWSWARVPAHKTAKRRRRIILDIANVSLTCEGV